jgi:hypothetical protein
MAALQSTTLDAMKKKPGAIARRMGKTGLENSGATRNLKDQDSAAANFAIPRT